MPKHTKNVFIINANTDSVYWKPTFQFWATFERATRVIFCFSFVPFFRVNRRKHKKSKFAELGCDKRD
jgi:hypothetical protein